MWLRRRFRLLMIVCRRRRGCSFGWALGGGGGEYFFVLSLWVARLVLINLEIDSETEKRTLPSTTEKRRTTLKGMECL